MINNRLNNIKKNYDLIIIGGGIYGATLLWEAAFRGLSAILVEKDDFCNATSANSLKIIHSGLRYLQEFDIKRIRDSVKELKLLLKLAPHLVQQIPCIIPTYPMLNKGKLALALALKLYGLISLDGRDANNGLVPYGRIISKNEFCDLIPIVSLDGITGGALWYDALNHNPERLVLTFVLSAQNRGADAMNYMECQNLIVRKERVMGIKAYDQLSRQELEIYGKIVVNATGPWINQSGQKFESSDNKAQYHFAKAVNLIIPRTLSGCAFGLKATNSIDDLYHQDRYLFFVPWRGETMIGTWYFNHSSSADDLKLTENELSRCIKQIKQVLPGLSITGQEINFVHLGLIPVELKSDKKEFRLKKHHILVDHGRHGRPDSLISVLGVKYTTARSVSAGIIDLISKKIGRKQNLQESENYSLSGGNIENIEQFIQEKKTNNYHKLTEKTIQHLVLNFGTKYNDIEKMISENVILSEFIPGSDESIVAELSYCMKNESVFHLSDLVLRRTGIGSLKKPKDETINFCADFMALELGWTEPQKNKEIKSLTKFYERISSN